MYPTNITHCTNPNLHFSLTVDAFRVVILIRKKNKQNYLTICTNRLLGTRSLTPTRQLLSESQKSYRYLPHSEHILSTMFGRPHQKFRSASTHSQCKIFWCLDLSRTLLYLFLFVVRRKLQRRSDWRRSNQKNMPSSLLFLHQGSAGLARRPGSRDGQEPASFSFSRSFLIGPCGVRAQGEALGAQF